VSSKISGRLASRAALSGLALPPILAERLVAYYELLQRWNRKINLTSLSNPDEAIDRLLLEPVAAAAVLPHRGRLIDLGTGGGSPAIPLALSAAASLLVMVESRSRKAAFLREAVRELGLAALVENARFEDLVNRPEYRELMDVVSVRAVRLDSPALQAAAVFLSPGGQMALFESATAPIPELPPGLALNHILPLLRSARLTVLRKESVPRGT
jgi:16S rRNA (guanine527-N7)-methyltransferase